MREKKGRDKEKCTLIEGFRLLSRALECNVPILELYFCRKFFLGENEDKLISMAQLRGAKIFETNSNVFRKFAYRDRPEGLAAIIPIKQHSLKSFIPHENATYLVLQSLEKPGNLGSILRTADGAGVDGVIICEKRTDIYNPNVLTASTGAIFTVPIAEDLSENICKWLRKNKIKIVITSPHAKKKYTDENMTGSIAIVIGSEQCGLDKFWFKHADSEVYIPMLGMADSLNAAISASILLYEIARQKEWRKAKK
ncbi:MAG TPA: RNA methyltransferase [Victivallales bacterium]|nr:RNA methyltransferase [Victivallales bacterium]HPO90799.1 RNA methyltransferase [Victivallales bacterium]